MKIELVQSMEMGTIHAEFLLVLPFFQVMQRDYKWSSYSFNSVLAHIQGGQETDPYTLVILVHRIKTSQKIRHLGHRYDYLFSVDFNSKMET
ncbi:hypothetical protein MKW92_032472 [Papaver armeniacum]|nr:hypothetical protein MKW92_032472 [Papaver armeniacum]